MSLVSCRKFLVINLIIVCCAGPEGNSQVKLENLPYKLYPETNVQKPGLSSPFSGTDGQTYVIAVTKELKYAIIPVTLGNKDRMCKQLMVDTVDFPYLASTGLHSEAELDRTQKITGRSIHEITELGRPGGLSQAGFLGRNEDLITVIKADNRTVKKLGLTHPQLARPLFHILNIMDADLKLERWNMARHRWENIVCFFYNDKIVYVEAEDTKGGQQSIFDDDIQGGFYIKIWRELEDDERRILEDCYSYLTPHEFDRFISLLTSMNAGEIEPQYIMRYGFYEGHTYWRTDPISIAFIFGLRSLESMEQEFPGELFTLLSREFTD